MIISICSRQWTTNGWLYRVYRGVRLCYPDCPHHCPRCHLSTEAIQREAPQVLRQWLKSNDPYYWFTTFEEWHSLSTDLLVRVAGSFQRPSTLALMAMTSKAWRVAALAERLWVPFVHEDFPRIRAALALLAVPGSTNFADLYGRQMRAKNAMYYEEDNLATKRWVHDDDGSVVASQPPSSFPLGDVVFSIAMGSITWSGVFCQEMIADIDPEGNEEECQMIVPSSRSLLHLPRYQVFSCLSDRYTSCWVFISPHRIPFPSSGLLPYLPRHLCKRSSCLTGSTKKHLLKLLAFKRIPFRTIFRLMWSLLGLWMESLTLSPSWKVLAPSFMVG